MPDKLDITKGHDTGAAEVERLRRRIAEVEAECDSSVRELLRLMCRNRRIAWAAVGACETKGAVGLALSCFGNGEWWLNAGSIAVGAGLAGVLIAPNARKLAAELRIMGSLTAKFRVRKRDRD